MANGYFGNIPQKDDLRPFGCYRADLEGPLLSFAFPGARVSDPAGVMPPAKSLILASNTRPDVSYCRACAESFGASSRKLLKRWWAVQDSNLRPPACKAGFMVLEKVLST